MDWINTNYSRSHKAEPIGVHRIWKNRSRNGRSITCNFYYVRVHNKMGTPTTIGKAKTKEEADALFLKHEPDWQGEIPYFENIDKRYKKNNPTTYKLNHLNDKTS